MPKIIRIDEEDDSESEFVWAYQNKDNVQEFVKFVDCVPSTIYLSDDNIYIEDIPNLIKALQAAHKHITNS